MNRNQHRIKCKSRAQSTQHNDWTFHLFNRKGKTMRDLSKESASFMWSQFLVDVLKRFPVDENTYEEMLRFCEECYREDKIELQKIQEFRVCQSRDVIRWYSKDSFLYRLLNTALRTEDVDDLYRFRGYIIDLCYAIECKQNQQRRQSDVFPTSGKCYRGQIMLESEFNRIKDSIGQGQLILVNSFFSASLDKNIAEEFAGCDLPDDEKSVLIEIDYDLNLQHTTFAFIGDQSVHPEEQEILFNLCAVFRMKNVYEDDKYGYIHLKTTDEGYEIFKEYHQFTQFDIECPTIEIVFGRLRMMMGQYEKAVKYFELLSAKSLDDENIHRVAICMHKSTCYYHMCKYQEAHNSLDAAFKIFELMNTPSSDRLYLQCRFYLANVYLFTNQLQSARIIFEEILRIQRETLPKTAVQIGDTLRALGKLLGNERGYHEALPYRQEALEIYKKTLPASHHKRIVALHDLAGCYEPIGKYQQALDILNEAVPLLNSCITDDHSLRAKVLRTIGMNQQPLGYWEQAFENYTTANMIWMLQFPQGHVFTAFCLNKMGEIYRHRKQLHEALECQLYALDMCTSLFPPGTPQPCHSLGLTYLDMNDKKKAVETLILARHYWWAKTGDLTSMYLLFVESCLATAYSHNGQLIMAHRTFKKVLRFQRLNHPEGNPDIGMTLHHMASNLKRMGKYHWAMRCYQESLDMFSQYFQDDHFEVVLVREKMMALQFIIMQTISSIIF